MDFLNLSKVFLKYADNEYWKKWYDKNKDKFKKQVTEHNKRRRKELQELIIEKKNVPCLKCNNDFHFSAMNLVHRNPKTKNFSLRDATRLIYSKTKLKEELDKCNVICSNCMKEETMNSYLNGKNRRRKKLQNIINEIKEKKCIDCGNVFPPFVMELDHLGKKKKVDSVAKMINEEKPLRIILKEVDKTEPICTNCHRVRTFKRSKKGFPKNANAKKDIKVRVLASLAERQEAEALERRVFSPENKEQKLQTSKDSTIYGAFEDGQLVGITRTTNNPLSGYSGPTLQELKKLKPEIWIAATGVDPEHRGKGVAKALRSHLQEKYSSILTGTGRKSDPTMTHINQVQGFVPVIDRPGGSIWHWSRDKQEERQLPPPKGEGLPVLKDGVSAAKKR